MHIVSAEVSPDQVVTYYRRGKGQLMENATDAELNAFTPLIRCHSAIGWKDLSGKAVTGR